MFKVASAEDISRAQAVYGPQHGYVYPYLNDINGLDKLAEDYTTPDIIKAKDMELYGALHHNDLNKIADEGTNFIRTHLLLESIVDRVIPAVPVGDASNFVKHETYDIRGRQIIIQERDSDWGGVAAVGSPILPTKSSPVIYQGNSAYIWYPEITSPQITKSDNEVQAYIGYDIVSYLFKKEMEFLVKERDRRFFTMLGSALNNHTGNFTYVDVSASSSTLTPDMFKQIEQTFSGNKVPLGFFVLNKSTWLETESWPRDYVGDSIVSQVIVNGIVFDSIHGIPVVTTMNSILPDGVIFGIGVPKYFGMNEDLVPPTSAVIPAGAIHTNKYQSAMTNGILIANDIAFGVLSYNDSYTTASAFVTYLTGL